MSELVAGLSGGLDSSVMFLYLTGYLRGGIQADVTGIFTDPGKEHPNTYRMLDTLEQMTGKDIVRLRGPSWEDALEANAWFLPYWKARWCTRVFKIRPFEAFVSGKRVQSHIGLRADEEERTGYVGDKGSNITVRYPLQEMSLVRSDIEDAARRVGLPPTGPWSCSCCPFKPMILQVQMIEEFPEEAEWMAWVEVEKERRGAGGYTWLRGYTMRDLIDNSEKRDKIRQRWHKRHPDESLDDPALISCLACRVK